jgi:tungstate transport system substrate-binding protein
LRSIGFPAGVYTLSDRGTWLSFATNAELKILVEGDPGLLNRYDVILLDPLRHPEAKQERNSGAQSRPISNA